MLRRQLRESRFGTTGLLLALISLCSWFLFDLLQSFIFAYDSVFLLWLLVFSSIAVASFVISIIGIHRDRRKLTAIIGIMLSMLYGPVFLFWGRFPR